MLNARPALSRLPKGMPPWQVGYWLSALFALAACGGGSSSVGSSSGVGATDLSGAYTQNILMLTLHLGL